MEQKKPVYNQNSPIYNIRILRIYIDFIEKNYPFVNIDEILFYSGISRLQLNDYGYWYNQKQANRFHEITVAKTGNKNIAKDAARYALKSQNLFAQYSQGYELGELAIAISDKFKNYSQKELAEHLKISYSGTKSRVQKAKEILRENILDCPNVESDSEGKLLNFENN